jgi:hypothetical protein
MGPILFRWAPAYRDQSTVWRPYLPRLPRPAPPRHLIRETLLDNFAIKRFFHANQPCGNLVVLLFYPMLYTQAMSAIRGKNLPVTSPFLN